MAHYGLIGETLKHSFSQKYFTKKFTDLGIQSHYSLFELPSIEEFPKLLADHPDLAGLNVTIPYKEDIIPFMDELSESAEHIGAVNTVKFDQGKLIGDNTDCIGFHTSLLELIGDAEISQAMVLGTGGASKAIKFVLKEWMGTDQVDMVSRSPREADHISYQELRDRDWSAYQLIVNTTPLGTYPNVDEAPYLPYEYLTDNHFVYDLVYNPAMTSFMKLAKAQGASVTNGYRMLVLQAEASWEIWQNS
ncbi:shikimate dehydrogenase [Pontibacter sp. G13]|uniref:shikimate dehydrogenase family protein n=1 Tax=Pontibacter sp. G13 TaxID=3074898 RepID=UPI00288C27D3|nr:shikimate dehydrogenase [Pontibacter sp. G13]WNJ15960.1 shikimate dehydrogenase [Pontibacter sp. G13]